MQTADADAAAADEEATPARAADTSATASAVAAAEDTTSGGAPPQTSGEEAGVTPEQDAPAGASASEVEMVGKAKTRLNDASSPVKTLRYEDAADGPAPTLVATVPKTSEEKSSAAGNVSNARDSVVSPDPAASNSTGSLRSTSSKIANLRAAFEKGTHEKGTQGGGGGGGQGSQKRLPSVDKAANGKVSGESSGNAEYEKEIARLTEALERERDTRQAYEEKCSVLEVEARRKRERESLQSNGMLKEEDDEVPAEIAPIVNRRRSADVMMLQRQLADLKRNISMSTRMDGQVTDSVFAQEMGVLNHELQNWIVASFRRARTDLTPEDLCSRLADIPNEPALRHLRPMYETFTPSAKLAIYQATAASLLMDVFAHTSLYALPEDLEWRKPLREAVSSLEKVLTPVAHNKWRAVTLDVIRQSEGMPGYVEPAANAMAERICSVLTALSDVERSEGRFYALLTIVKRAIDLQHLFLVQRARYQFDLPSPQDDYHHEVMENIAVDDESTVDLIPSVRCATFPSVIKVGDELGDNVHLTNVIVKAKVLCSS